MVQLSAQIRNLEKVQEQLSKLTGAQASSAYSKALNDVGFRVWGVMRKELRTEIDRVTPYILNSVYVDKATPQKLSVRIAPNNRRDSPGVDPQKILQAQEFGGRRRDKRSEVALRRAGILPSGYQIAIPRVPYPGSDDGRGNLKGSFMVQMISYFQASPEQGYSANMTDKRKRAIHKGNKRTTGRRYFVSYGRLRGHHLAPGIWATSGTGGVDVRPVVMFVRVGTYKPRLSMERIAQGADVQNYLDKRVRFRIREAAGV